VKVELSEEADEQVRLLLRRTQYHLYFVPDTARVYVLAVWSAFRGRAPTL
jgi:hypothetical protein